MTFALIIDLLPQLFLSILLFLLGIAFIRKDSNHQIELWSENLKEEKKRKGLLTEYFGYGGILLILGSLFQLCYTAYSNLA